MEGPRFRLARALLAASAIVVSAVVHSLYVAVGLAIVVVAVEFGRFEKRRERAWRAQLEKEQAEMSWYLVPGPGA
jgi:hypothetical protein